MEAFWKEVVPGDQYMVSIDGPINEGDLKVLTFLYQPLIGPVCISLYTTFLNQIEENRLSSEWSTHYFVMNLLNINIPEILHARQKLEAIGLLKTYVKTNEDQRMFLYMLQPPLSPHDFFTDGLLNIYLYQKIGDTYYKKLKRFFTDKALELDGFDEVTKGFDEVFASTTSVLQQHQEEIEDDLDVRLPAKTIADPIQVVPEDFDYELFYAGLNDALVNKKSINSETKEVILKLAFLYGINPIEMQKLVEYSTDEANQIDLKKLRINARDWYKIENYNAYPSLVDKVQPPIYHSDIDVPKTQKEERIRYLERVSPRELLEDISGGAKASETDLKLIEEIMIEQKLQPGVVNVLIEYCLLKTDMKLQKNYVKTIAAHWARKQVKTVKEAMELAISENQQYQEWKEKAKQRKTSPGKKPIRTEKVPDWFESRQKLEVKTEEVKNFEEERRKLEEELKQFKK